MGNINKINHNHISQPIIDNNPTVSIISNIPDYIEYTQPVYDLDFCYICDDIYIPSIYNHCKNCNKCHHKCRYLYCKECNLCMNPHDQKLIIIHKKRCILFRK